MKILHYKMISKNLDFVIITLSAHYKFHKAVVVSSIRHYHIIPIQIHSSVCNIYIYDVF